MAFKRTTKKTGPGTRSSRTIHSNGGHATNSTSMTTGNMTITRTQKGSKSYTTQTIRRADGFVERKRIHSNAIKKYKGPDLFSLLFSSKRTRKRRSKGGTSSNGTAFILIILFVILIVIFG